jgi:hypothetical protein
LNRANTASPSAAGSRSSTSSSHPVRRSPATRASGIGSVLRPPALRGRPSQRRRRQEAVPGAVQLAALPGYLLRTQHHNRRSATRPARHTAERRVQHDVRNGPDPGKRFSDDCAGPRTPGPGHSRPDNPPATGTTDAAAADPPADALDQLRRNRPRPHLASPADPVPGRRTGRDNRRTAVARHQQSARRLRPAGRRRRRLISARTAARAATAYRAGPRPDPQGRRA